MRRHLRGWTTLAALGAFAGTAWADPPPEPARPRPDGAPPCSDGTGAPAPARAREPVRDSVGSFSGRVIAEILMGSGVGTVGFLLGPQLANAGCRSCYYAAAFAGASAAFPLGVFWGGYVGDGDGSFWLTATGPWLVTTATATALALDRDGDGEPALRIATIGGAIAAPLSIVVYELTSLATQPSAPDTSAVPLPRITVSPRRGGLTVGLSGSL